MPFPISGIHKTVECHVVLGLLAEEKKQHTTQSTRRAITHSPETQSFARSARLVRPPLSPFFPSIFTNIDRLKRQRANDTLQKKCYDTWLKWSKN